MSNPSKKKGTDAEVRVVDYLNSRGWNHAERRALAGSKDRGDVAGIPGVVLEVKSEAKHDLAGWMKEALVEQHNDNADVGAVVAKKRGTTLAGDWYAVLPFSQLCDLLEQAGYR